MERGNVDDLLRTWLRRTRESQWAHYAAERAQLRGHYAMGIPLVLLTAFTGTSVFAALSREPDTWFKVVVGVTSVGAAILSGLQTFLRTTDRAALHRDAAASYAAARRALEQLLVERTDESPAEVTRIRELLSDLAQQTPAIPPRIWDRTERRLAQR